MSFDDDFARYIARLTGQQATLPGLKLEPEQIIEKMSNLKNIFLKNDVDSPSYDDTINRYRTYLLGGQKAKPEIMLLNNFFNENTKLIYLFTECGMYFPSVYDRLSWNGVVQNAPITGEFANFDKIRLFLSKSKIQKFGDQLIEFFNLSSKFIYHRIDDFTKILKEDPYFIDYLPDAFYAILFYIKKLLTKEKNYMDEDSTHLFDRWLEFINVAKLDDIPQRKIISGIKWLVILNESSFFGEVIFDFLKDGDKDGISVEDVVKNLFLRTESEISGTTYEIIESVIYEGNKDTFFAQKFKEVLMSPENKNLVPSFFYRRKDLLLKLLNAGQFGNQYGMFKTPFSFSNNVELNKDILPAFVNQNNFKHVLFNTVIQILTLNNLDNYTGRKRQYYQEGIEYLLKQVTNLIKTYNINITFEQYIYLKEKLPESDFVKSLITKESIIEFLNREDPDPAIIQAWEEMWALQNTEEAPPPVPMWFILQYDASNVHNKGVIKITDCRLKLLRENNKDVKLTIDDIAEDVEKDTRKVAEINAKTEKVKIGENQYRPLTEVEEMKYIDANTVTRREIFNCRISEEDPRYYGYGEIYDQARAKQLPEDERVEICRVLVEIWNVIQSTRDHELMWRTLITQFTGIFKEHLNEGVCNQGLVGSMTSVFASFAKELGYLCIKEDDDSVKVEELKDKFLIDMRGDVVKDWPTIQKLFVKISNILYDAILDEDEWREPLEEEMKMAPTEEERKIAENKIKSFEEKIQMYQILFEPEDDVSTQTRKETMIKFVSNMKPTFFMEAYDYFKNESLANIKKAVNKAFMEFTEFQLNKIR